MYSSGNPSSVTLTTERFTFPTSTGGRLKAGLWKAEDFKRFDSIHFYFGLNAIQDEDYLYINKNDLNLLSDTAESLFVGLINRLIGLTDENIHVILVSLFDVYVEKGRLMHTIVIHLLNALPEEEIDLDSIIYSEINPNNYG